MMWFYWFFSIMYFFFSTFKANGQSSVFRVTRNTFAYVPFPITHLKLQSSTLGGLCIKFIIIWIIIPLLKDLLRKYSSIFYFQILLPQISTPTSSQASISHFPTKQQLNKNILDLQQLRVGRFHIQTMQAYTNMVKTLYTTGKDYIWSASEKAKEPMVKVDKTATIYEAKAFHDSKVDPKKCISTLAKLIYLFNQGEPFTEDEATSLFFSITKLFQAEDPSLRRLIYTFVKEMSDQPSIYVVTSSLLKDIHHKDCNYRRNSLRTLPVVLDSSNLVQVQRYIKQLMNDSDPGVVSAALLSGLQMYQTNEEVVRKWGAQVTEKLKSKDKYVQYHSLALIGEIKRKDTKFLKKTLESMIKQVPTGLAGIQHLRMLKLVVEQSEFDSPQVTEFINFVLRQVRSSDDNVVIEAAKIACQSSFFSNKDLLEVVKVLQRFLVSESTAKKYTVLKLYNSLLKNSSRKNLVVNVKQIEKVLKDKNVNLSSTAASILLRICSENYLQALLNGLTKTMCEMSIEYKIDVIKSLVNVLTTYPKQFTVINNFILRILKEQESEDLRREAIQVMSYEITEIGGEAKKQCLQEIAKFLSSAKYEKIHFQILGIINREIKVEDVTSDLLKSLIHQIYLQEGSIRACGLSTLMKISEINAEKRKILERTIAKFEKDRDQEVRERVIFRPTSQKISLFELDMIEGYLFHNCEAIQSSKDPNMFSLSSIKKWGEEEAGSTLLRKKKKISNKGQQPSKQAIEQQKHYKQLFLNHSTFKNYGQLRKINQKTLISDAEAQLQVCARVFLFDSNLVIMYEIENRFESTVLENVKVEIKHSGEEFQTQHIIPAKQILVGGKGQAYVGVGRNEQSQQMLPEESISSVLKFVAKQYSGQTLKASYEDEFSLENLQIKLSTYISQWPIESSDFQVQWKKIGSEAESQTYQLAYASKQAAIQELIKKFGMTCVSNQEVKNARSSINLSGKYLGTYKTLMNIVIGFDTKLGCITKATVISEKEDLATALIQSLA